MGLVNVSGHTFVGHTLGPTSVVLDCGANEGTFSSAIVTQYGSRCWSVEPNPAVAAHIMQDPRITVLNCLLDGTSGQRHFYVSDVSVESTIDEAGKNRAIADMVLEAITLKDLMDRAAAPRINLAKFDIEGAEIAVFDSCDDELLLRIDQLTVEFHDFCGLTPVTEVRRVLDRFRRLGFEVIRMTAHAHGDILIIQPSAIGLSWLNIAWYRHIVRNSLGFNRIGRRFLRKLRRSST